MKMKIPERMDDEAVHDLLARAGYGLAGDIGEVAARIGALNVKAAQESQPNLPPPDYEGDPEWKLRNLVTAAVLVAASDLPGKAIDRVLIDDMLEGITLKLEDNGTVVFSGAGAQGFVGRWGPSEQSAGDFVVEIVYKGATGGWISSSKDWLLNDAKRAMRKLLEREGSDGDE